MLTAYPGQIPEPEPVGARVGNVRGQIELRADRSPNEVDPGYYPEPDPRAYRRWHTRERQGTRDAVIDLQDQRDTYERGGPHRFITLQCGCGVTGTAYVADQVVTADLTDVRCRRCAAEPAPVPAGSARTPATNTDHAARDARRYPTRQSGVSPGQQRSREISAAAGPEGDAHPTGVRSRNQLDHPGAVRPAVPRVGRAEILRS